MPSINIALGNQEHIDLVASLCERFGYQPESGTTEAFANMQIARILKDFIRVRRRDMAVRDIDEKHEELVLKYRIDRQNSLDAIDQVITTPLVSSAKGI